ncbi:MAG: SMP-30/gluconolactonase/LRE family protein [Pseudomonadota bacterium]
MTRMTLAGTAAAAAILVSIMVGAEANVGRENLSILVETDAHEGPVVVTSQNRLYFTTKPDFAAEDTFIAIRYVDLATNEVETFRPRSNMANGMWLTRDGTALLVAEQGTRETPGGISRIRLADGHREVLVDSFEGQPFHSPNKVIEAESGWIYFSDPDYGFNQGFKDQSPLPMAVYAFDPTTETTVRLTIEPDRPHGLASSPDGKTLYIGDTDAIDGKSPYDPNKTRGVLGASLETSDKIGELTDLLSVPEGIPDGFITTPNGDLWVAAGDGVRRYTAEGEFLELLPIENGAVNLTRDGNVLYITADTAIWRAEID